MTAKNRIRLLEKKLKPSQSQRIFVYYYDPETGYSASSEGETFSSLEELAAAQGWDPSNQDTLIKVVYAEQKSVDIQYPSGESISLGVDWDRL